MRVIDVLSSASSQLGVKEKTGNNDGVKYNTWYYGRDVSGPDYPWCMVFVQWIFAMLGKPLPYRTASCSALYNWYLHNRPEDVHKDPKPGDVVIYAGHTGIVETIDGPNNFTAIEGNYSNKVSRVPRKMKEAVAFLRPEYDTEEKVMIYDKIEDCPVWARPAVKYFVDAGILKGVNDKGDLNLDDMKVWTLVILYRCNHQG